MISKIKLLYVNTNVVNNEKGVCVNVDKLIKHKNIRGLEL